MIGRSALVVPTPAKSRARVKFMAEQVSSLEAWRIPESSSRTVKASSTIMLRALPHAGWLLTHCRRKGGDPTAYDMRSGRKYNGKVANVW